MKITRDDDFGGALLNCAVRYALGRASYMPGLVMGEITPMLPDCSDKTLWCFDQDVSEWLSDALWVDNKAHRQLLYADEWKRFHEAVQEERAKRKSGQS